MQITAAEFKAKCLKLMDEITRTREPIVITKHGKPIAKLLPADEPPRSLFGYMKDKGRVEFLGDIVDVPVWDWSVDAATEEYEDEELYGALKQPGAGQTPDSGAAKMEFREE